MAACTAVLASSSFGLLAASASRVTPVATPVIADEPRLAGDVPLSAEPAMNVLSETRPPGVLKASTPEPAQTPAPVELQLTPRTYVVEAGDSVRSIAHQFGVTNETVIWENDLSDPDQLEIGQTLQILPFSGLIHEVRPGDTIASLANSYDARLDDVIKANKLTEPFIIVVGQKIAVPGGYRPLPQRVIVAPTSRDDSDTVQAPPTTDGQQAAAVQHPKRTYPLLGGTPQEQFIGSIGEAAVASADATGVPASVTIAQAILESFWGSSRLAREANNYFGIKAQTRNGPAGAVWFDVWEVIGGRNVMQSEPFRKYNTVAESFVDHGRFFVDNGRYAGAMAARGDPRLFAREVNRAGYATDPAYASKLIGLMDRYNLYRYDDV